MSERQVRVGAIAKILRDAIFRRGQDWWQAAEEVLDAMESEAAWEYNIETTDLITGHTSLLRALWEPDTDWLERKMKTLADYDAQLLNAGGELEYTRRLVKRRKAGKVEDV